MSLSSLKARDLYNEDQTVFDAYDQAFFNAIKKFVECVNMQSHQSLKVYRLAQEFLQYTYFTFVGMSKPPSQSVP